jgi:hypothetical protein
MPFSELYRAGLPKAIDNYRSRQSQPRHRNFSRRPANRAARSSCTAMAMVAEQIGSYFLDAGIRSTLSAL